MGKRSFFFLSDANLLKRNDWPKQLNLYKLNLVFSNFVTAVYVLRKTAGFHKDAVVAYLHFLPHGMRQVFCSFGTRLSDLNGVRLRI